jgi:hypothetical protein
MASSPTPRTFSFLTFTGLRWVAVVTLGALLGAAAARAEGIAPKWQTFSSSYLGLSVEVTAATHVSYRINLEGFVAVAVEEGVRFGPKITERSSSFSFDVIDLGDMRITDPHGIMRRRADAMITNPGVENFKVVKNETLKVDGLPAREVIFSSTIDFFDTPVTYRYLFVAGGNRFYTFNWVWNDAGPVPADSRRISGSIRFRTPTPIEHVRSRAMLEDTIRYYWMRDEYPKRIHFTPALRAIADPKRTAESKMVNGYGSVQQVNFRTVENGYRVFRVEHTNAIVDWYIADNGKQITALTWKKVRDR